MDLNDCKNMQLGVNKVSMPFYEPPPRKTSAEIINEARLAIKESEMVDSSFVATSIKPLQTQRPFTPRDKERLLFGNKEKLNRPPSSFSLRYLQDETEIPTNIIPDSSLVLTPNQISFTKSNSVPVPKRTSKHFESISDISNSQIFNIDLKECLHKIKLPSLDHKPLQRRKSYKNISLDKLPEEDIVEISNHETRKAFSSPQEKLDRNNHESPFGRPSKRQSLSQCLLLGPQHLNKIFDNKQIIENSETLFLSTGYFNNDLQSKVHSNISVEQKIQQRTVEDVLHNLNYESNKTNNDEIVIELLDDLYQCMEKEGLIGAKVSSKMKINILKCLYKFVESRNDQLLLNIGRVILTLKVTGNNLSGVCKLVFKVAKTDKNDHLFFQKNVLELFLDALGRSSPLDDGEACIYGYGAIKFLTMNQKLLNKILELGILQLMVLHIKIINNAKTDNSLGLDHTNHVLYQLTGALRNLVSEENICEAFTSCGAVGQLCQALELFSSDIDITSNISRTLSTISTNDCCCDSLADYKNIYKMIIKIFEKHSMQEEIVVRLAYTLGNIVAKIDNTRVKFFHEPNSISSLLNLWRIYLDKTLKVFGEQENTNSNPQDVMVKVIRIVANIVINPDIGKSVNETQGDALLEELLKVLISNPFKKNEELVMSSLSTLNNLSYYYESTSEKDIFHLKQIDIVEAIAEHTKSKNKECVTESMRILGNLSRSKTTRSFIAESDIFQVLLKLLDKADITLLKTVIGVLVNLMADNKSRNLFKSSGGVCKLIAILINYVQTDWLLGMLVCQVLWNYSIDSVDLYELITEQEMQKLLATLADYLDEEKLFGIMDSGEELEIYITQEYLIWEEFANVATNLLEKIENFLDTFEQIHVPDDKTEKPEKHSNVEAW